MSTNDIRSGCNLAMSRCMHVHAFAHRMHMVVHLVIAGTMMYGGGCFRLMRLHWFMIDLTGWHRVMSRNSRSMMMFLHCRHWVGDMSVQVRRVRHRMKVNYFCITITVIVIWLMGHNVVGFVLETCQMLIQQFLLLEAVFIVG
jgi:hypothetical protein